MEWWFRASDHEVKIVILVKLSRHQETILVEKYGEEAQSARPGATTTRSSGALVPVRQQEIGITRDSTAHPHTFNIVRGDLVLGFRQLFLRAPGPGEGDVVVSVQDLKEYAALVWSTIED
jgi:hypothetical protein